MSIEQIALTKAAVVSTNLLTVCFSDGTEAVFTVAELLACKPERHLSAEEYPEVEALLKA